MNEVPRSPVVGRDRELERLRAVLDAPATWPAAVLLEGEAGAGKTALWTAAVALARDRLVLRARPSGAEAQLAFSALGDLLDGVPEAIVRELPGLQRRALEAALLVGDEEQPDADLRAVAVAVLSVLRRLAGERPVLVAVDDEQWLDGPSAAALTFALRRLRGEPVLALLARRTAGAAEPVVGLAAALEPARLQRIPVGPLELEPLRRLLEATLGVSWTRPVLVRIHATSGGNPLYALELARALARGDTAVPATLRGLLSDRLSRLPSSAVDLLAVAAACDQPDVAVLAAAAGRDVSGDLDAAVADGIVVFEGRRMRFAHPLLAAVAHAAVPERRRREIHRRLAEVLREPEQRAIHLALAASGADERTARVLAAAAERAHARGATLTAADLAQHALRLTPGDHASETSRRALAAADYLFAAGGSDAARATLEREAAAAPAGAPRAEALVRLALLDSYDGELASARAHAVAALEEGGAEPALEIVIRRRLAMVHLLLGELAAAEPHAEAALRLAEAHAGADVIAQARANLTCLRVFLGRLPVGEAVDELAGAGQVAGPASIDDSPVAIRSLLQMYAGDLDGARTGLDACIDVAAERGDESSLAGLLFCRAELECRAGRFGDAAVLAERGLEASTQTGQRLTRSVSLFAKGLATAYLGREREARACTEEGMAIAVAAGHRFAEAQNLWALGQLELSLGRHAEAAAALGRVLAIGAAAELRLSSVLPVVADAVEAQLGSGDLEGAAARLDDGPAGPESSRAEALVRAARGEPEAAARMLEAALEAGGSRSAFATGRMQLALGQVLRRARSKAPARAALTKAVERFSECGAVLWQARAVAELGRIGGRGPATTTLTPTERRVAELVALGGSNKAVAATLFVTVGTVEAHLSRIYAKLGVRSRAELAHHAHGAGWDQDGQSVGVSGISTARDQP